MRHGFLLLVVAKAPVPGLAKTRLCPPATPDRAAEIAAAALLDTLDAVRRTPGALPLVAMTGDLDNAARAAELRSALAGMPVLAQRGNGFAERLVNAHADAAAWRPGRPVLQIGMDTPQVTPELLADAVAPLATSDAVLGPADDGGWWSLGLRDPRHAAALATVPMSTEDTGERTREALESLLLTVSDTETLSDVDTMVDALRVASAVPGGRFAATVAGIGVVRR